jgi:alkanesulfonate monooxygenase SsuD/methylene tetrahydromethanopterin reductase-like flavin-dependent oxidoreductase (luciferase family)
VKAKAQWAENRGLTWFSVVDHRVQVDVIGAADEPTLEWFTVLAMLASVTSRIRLASLAASVG